MAYKQTLSKEKAAEKIKQYCAYQERCHAEVKEKLYSFGLYKADVELIICQLIEENYLNEERFAIQYAGGKFRIKQWGKIKITHALKQKQISNYCILQALKQIPMADYEHTLLQLATKKWTTLKGEHYITRSAKTQAYLLQKGYENKAISQALAFIKEK
jgi:regulatory protein